MEVGAFVTLRAEAKAAELFALSLTAQVEGVGKLALVAFLAEAALVMFANEMTNSRALVWRSIVAVRTSWTKRTMAVLVGRACRTVVFVREAEGRECALEIRQEGQVGDRRACRV